MGNFDLAVGEMPKKLLLMLMRNVSDVLLQLHPQALVHNESDIGKRQAMKSQGLDVHVNVHRDGWG